MSSHRKLNNYAGRGGPHKPAEIQRTCSCGWKSEWVTGYWGNPAAQREVDKQWRAHVRSAASGQLALGMGSDSHQCGADPLRCGRCGHVIAATGDLPEHLARAAAANHKFYCSGRAS